VFWGVIVAKTMDDCLRRNVFSAAINSCDVDKNGIAI
jgi:hypothetical protein